MRTILPEVEKEQFVHDGLVEDEEDVGWGGGVFGRAEKGGGVPPCC